VWGGVTNSYCITKPRRCWAWLSNAVLLQLLAEVAVGRVVQVKVHCVSPASIHMTTSEGLLSVLQSVTDSLQ